jgi:hypothetical protein
MNIVIHRLQTVWIVHSSHQLCRHPRHEDVFFSHATYFSYQTSSNMTFWLSLPYRLCAQISRVFCDRWMWNTLFNKILMWYTKCKNDKKCLVSDDTLKPSTKLCYDLHEGTKRLVQHMNGTEGKGDSDVSPWSYVCHAYIEKKPVKSKKD